MKKAVPSAGETTVFAYDASGKMVAEYSTNVEPVATATPRSGSVAFLSRKEQP